MFVATVACRTVAKGGITRDARGRIIDTMHGTLKRDLALILTGQGGQPFASLTQQDVAVRSNRVLLCDEAAPNLEVSLRYHEEALVPHRAVQYVDALSSAFVQYAGAVLCTVQQTCQDAELGAVRLLTWLPRTSGVDLDVPSGTFVRTWGDVFRVGTRLQFTDPV